MHGQQNIKMYVLCKTARFASAEKRWIEAVVFAPRYVLLLWP